jgi:hypothetical protein
LSKWWDVADANSKKILAEASHVSDTFIDTYLAEAQTKQIPLIVCGDINENLDLMPVRDDYLAAE